MATNSTGDSVRAASLVQPRVSGAVRLGLGVSSFAGVFALVLLLDLLFPGLWPGTGVWMT